MEKALAYLTISTSLPIPPGICLRSSLQETGLMGEKSHKSVGGPTKITALGNFSLTQ